MLNVVLFGPPGAGKGTQSELIVEKYQLVHISTGDLLRAEIKKQSVIGIEAQKLINSGNFVSDEIVIQMIEEVVASNTTAKGFIFDGFPRTTYQAEVLDVLLSKYNQSVSCMLCLEVESAELVSRLLTRGKVSNRPDDQSEEVIMKRITIYHEMTEPVKKFYNKQGKLREIDGIGDLNQIFDKIVASFTEIKK